MLCVDSFPGEIHNFVVEGIWPGENRQFGPHSSMGFTNMAGELSVGAIFHNWEPFHATIEISFHIADKHTLTRNVARVIMGYVFNTLKVRYLVSKCAEDDSVSRKLNKRGLNANEYILPDLWGEGVGMVIFTLDKQRWLNSVLNGVQHGISIFSK